MNHNPILYIMQGVPGSGKSTIAEFISSGITLLEGECNCLVCSTDDYFVTGNGHYEFKFEKLDEYHKMNFQRTCEHLKNGLSVIVDNTNILRKHAKPYVEFAVSLNIPVVFIRVNGNFISTHGVPQKTIDKMREQMQNLTVESVLNS